MGRILLRPAEISHQRIRMSLVFIKHRMLTENNGNFPRSAPQPRLLHAARCASPCQMWEMLLHGKNRELTQKKMQEETKEVSRMTPPRLWDGSCAGPPENAEVADRVRTLHTRLPSQQKTREHQKPTQTQAD